MTHENRVSEVFQRSIKVLKCRGVKFRIMEGRRAPVNTVKNYSLGYINLVKKIVTIDIYTPKKRAPKSLRSILGVIAHEIAHLQKPPYRQRYRGRMIWRQHYPKFYKQVNKNFNKLLKDKAIKELIKK